jgi:hypothetical protein
MDARIHRCTDEIFEMWATNHSMTCSTDVLDLSLTTQAIQSDSQLISQVDNEFWKISDFPFRNMKTMRFSFFITFQSYRSFSRISWIYENRWSFPLLPFSLPLLHFPWLGSTFLCPLRRENTEETPTCREEREWGRKDENDSRNTWREMKIKWRNWSHLENFPGW